MNEISNKIGEETSVCATYIKNLIMLGIVKKESPYGEKSSRKTIYSIEDNMFRFWYQFVPENTSLISRGATELETLAECGSLFHCEKKHFYIFARTGFTKGCMDRAAEMGNVTLVTYDDMLKAE